MAEKARALFEIEREIATFRASEALDKAARSIAGGLGASAAFDLDPDQIRFAEEAVRGLKLEVGNLETGLRDLSDVQLRSRFEAINVLKDQINSLGSVRGYLDDLSEALGVTSDEAAEIAARFAEIGEAKGPRAQAAAMFDLATYVRDSSDGLKDANKEGKDLYDRLLAAAIEALNLARTDLASPIGEGADEAERLAKNLIMARTQISLLQSSKVYSGRGGDPRQFDRGGSQSRENYSASVKYTEIDDLIEQLNKPKGRRRRGGRKRGRSSAEKEHTKRLREKERVLRDIETATERYNRELKDLDELHRLTYLTTEQHAKAVGKLTEEYDAVRFEGLIEISERLEDTLVDSFDGATDSVKDFLGWLKKAAIQYALFGKGPFSSAFGGQTGGTAFNGLLGGLVGGLFGGFRERGGPVSAGKAYVVGEKRPELFVPKTGGTIIPQVPQGGVAGVHVSVSMDDNGNLQAFVDQTARHRAGQAGAGVLRKTRTDLRANMHDAELRGR